MAKETKNIITREECKREVMKSVKFDVYLYSGIFTAAVLMFLPFIPLIGKAAKVHWLWGIVMFFALFAIHIVLLGFIIYHVKIMRSVKRNGVNVVIDKAARLSEEMVYSFPRRYRIAPVIYFRDHGRQIYTGPLFELFSQGDEFYLVILKARKTKVVAIYNTRFYELKD